ncbi:type II 3-dehydroquinate dehydratase [Actinomadura rudentiformis]|uniref:3-dehydroquinate dehydratase n=1 Tax=Actinomadura rudentiformis TaxID=359158 RepID=A0A6H9YN19_9ACTN|nr:type II 3-dehydroquinate dehydratase [Actinomadura rudentiformis]KAB2343748.1 type II 3-dehydroquinate dehydratase [Actinomadura rudentiformis]
MPGLKPVLFLNGPNLNLLGTREPGKYGTTTLAEIEKEVREAADEHGLAVRFTQSNHEGTLIDQIHLASTECQAIVINPGGLTHTSVALRDSIAAVRLTTVEVHITNTHRREHFRHHSYISAVADAVILGAGTHGYLLALRHIAHLLAAPGPLPATPRRIT